MTQIDIGYTKKFIKEKKKLARKYPSIESDFKTLNKL